MSTLSQNATAIRLDIQPSNTLNLFITSTSKHFFAVICFRFMVFILHNGCISLPKRKNLWTLQTSKLSSNQRTFYTICFQSLSSHWCWTAMKSMCLQNGFIIVTHNKHFSLPGVWQPIYNISTRCTMIWSMTLNIFHEIRIIDTFEL